MSEHVEILLLEDNEQDAELAQWHLRKGGIDAKIKRVVAEPAFREELISGNHDLILADFHLPDFNGMKALEIARELAPKTPFIFMSGSLGEEVAVEALKNGATDYIVKDRPSRLGAAVRSALTHKREAVARDRMREALIESERINQLILSYAAEGIMAIARDGALVFANPAAERMLDWAHESFVPDVHAALHPGEDIVAGCPFLADIRGETSRASETTFTKATGQRLDVRYTAAAIVERGDVRGSVITFANITARKRLERQLEQTQRVSALGQVAATIAHEFNNVLMGIQPFAEVIRGRTEDEKILRATAQIATSVARGKRVTEEILRFTQPAEPSLQSISPGDWPRHLLPELKSLVGESIEIAVRFPDKPIAMRTDPAQLQQVLTNLVLNAKDAIQGNGLVTITVYDQDNNVMLTVSNDGCGMSREVLEHIFDPLFTTKRTGTGLGLAVAHQIIARQGGTISAESVPDKGTTFSIVVPAAPVSSIHPIEPKKARRPTVQRVVLVEDEVAISEGISMLLELEGVAVRTVALGADALSAIESFRPDVVILDMSLPDMDGAEVFRHIAAAHSTMPVLFSSGHGDLASVDPYFDSNRVAFLRKPYELDELLEALERLAGPGPDRINP